MTEQRDLIMGHEPSIETVELLCERLGELGLPIGPDTARELARAVLASEAPRVDARVRDSLDTALQTIRTATQSAMGVLAATVPGPAAPPPRTAPLAAPASLREDVRREPAPRPAPQREASSREPPPQIRQPARTTSGSRPIGKRPSGDQARPPSAPPPPAPPRPARNDFDEGERRPIFRRPRGR